MGTVCSTAKASSEDEGGAGPSGRKGGQHGVAEDVQQHPLVSAVRWQTDAHALGVSHMAVQASHRGKLSRVHPSSADGDGVSALSPRPAWEAARESHTNGHGGHIRSYTAEELKAAGFATYSASTAASKLPASGTQPLAFLAFESVEQTAGMPGKRHRNRLVPLHCNASCARYFKITSTKDYAAVLRKLLKRDPLLTFALQKALRYLKSGENKSVSHVTPDPSGQTSSLFGMRITPCVWACSHRASGGQECPCPPGQARISSNGNGDGGCTTLQAALLVEHNVAYNPAEVMPRLMRDYAVLSHVPAILTLIDYQGKVLYQNASSLTYMGDLLSAQYEHRLSEGLLRPLFAYDSGSLEEMLDDVLDGQQWQGVVQVPYSLRRFLASNQAVPDALGDDSGSFTIHGGMDSGKSRTKANEAGGALGGFDHDVEFQVGSSFSARHSAAAQAARLRGNRAPYAPGPKPNRPALLSAAANTAGSAPSVSTGQLRQPPGVSALSDPALVSPTGGAASLRPLSGLQSLAPGDESTQSTDGGSSQRMSPGPPHGVSDSVPHMQITSALPQHGMHGMQPNRKFMSLLDKTPNQARVGRASEPSANSGALALVGDPGTAAQSRVHSPEGGEGGGLGAEEERIEYYDESRECYHEVHAIPLLDPVLDKQVIMLVQTDVTPRVELENKLADLTDAQLSMLEQLFPRHIIEYMLARVPGPGKGSRNLRDLANTHEQVMVLFCDVVGFTAMSREVEPSQVMHFLNELYEVFDDLVDEYGMYKLDIVGDCYIVVAGLIKEDQDGFVCVDEMDEDQITTNAVRIMQFAKAMLRESLSVLMPHNSEPVALRIGIHTGPLVSGLVGAKMPKFTLFGDTMNTASRMESTCRPGCVHVSDEFATLLPHEDWQSTGGVQVKGKGLMQTMLWVPNSLRPELLELESDGAARTLRKVLTGGSFMSTRSRVTTRSTSMRSRRTSAAGARSDEHVDRPTINPLQTILDNIRRGDESDAGDGELGPGVRDSTGTLALAARPKSARRLKGHRASAGYEAFFDGGSANGAREGRATSQERSSTRRPSDGFNLMSDRFLGSTLSKGSSVADHCMHRSHRAESLAHSNAKRSSEHQLHNLAREVAVTSAQQAGASPSHLAHASNMASEPWSGALSTGGGGTSAGAGAGGQAGLQSAVRRSDVGGLIGGNHGVRPSGGRERSSAARVVTLGLGLEIVEDADASYPASVIRKDAAAAAAAAEAGFGLTHSPVQQPHQPGGQGGQGTASVVAPSGPGSSGALVLSRASLLRGGNTASAHSAPVYPPATVNLPTLPSTTPASSSPTQSSPARTRPKAPPQLMSPLPLSQMLHDIERE